MGEYTLIYNVYMITVYNGPNGPKPKSQQGIAQEDQHVGFARKAG